MNRRPIDNRFFIDGESIYIETFIAMQGGSVCKIRNTGTAIDGINIYLDAGSVDEPLKIKLCLNTGYIRLSDGSVYRNPVIQLLFEKNISLKKPLKIAVPVIDNNGSLFVHCFYIDDEGSLSPVVSTPELLYEDNIKRFSIYTFHSGLFTWINQYQHK